MSGTSARRLVRASRRAKKRAVRAVGLRPELEHLTMGRCSYGDPAVIVYKGDTAMAHIGAFVSIADDVRISWWDWPMATIRDAVPMLSDGAIDDFIARFDPGPAN